MPLISESYRQLNRKLHETHPTYGISAGHFRDFVVNMVKQEGHKSVLDYGCGKGVLGQMLPSILPDLEFREYDPAIDGKDGTPAPAELVVCLDVLEHVEPEHLNSVLRHMQGLTQRKLFFNIALRPAEKILEDGRNAHLIQRDEIWWRQKMRQYFQITSWDVQPGKVFGEAFPIKRPVIKVDDRSQGRKRRPIPRQMLGMFDFIRAHSKRYADEIHRINTISMFEGVGDTPADMQIMCNILDDYDDIEMALRCAIQLARLSVMVTMKCTVEDGPMWRRVFERRLRIVDWHMDQGGLVMTGSPMVGVQGITALGAVEEEDRWAQTKANTARITKRIQPAPEHDKVAVLACYGPSLGGMIDSIRAAKDAGGVVVSVSGSHDFLLERGIVPTYHIECDPRLHKADNIAKPHPDVQYLIASVCHPGYFDKLEAGAADIRLWHISSAEQTMKLVDELGEKGEHTISGGGSVGLRSIPLLYSYGFRNFAIYGMDSNFHVPADVIAKMQELLVDPKNEPEALKLAQECQQWAGKHAGKRQQVCTVMCGERLFVSSPILLTYATGFFETIQKMPDVRFRIYGDSLIAGMCALYANLPQLRDATAKAA